MDVVWSIHVLIDSLQRSYNMISLFQVHAPAEAGSVPVSSLIILRKGCHGWDHCFCFEIGGIGWHSGLSTTLSYSHTHKSMDNCCVASASYHVHGLDQTIVCISFLGHESICIVALFNHQTLKLILQKDLWLSWQVNKQRGISIGWAKRGGAAFAPGAENHIRFTNHVSLELLYITVMISKSLHGFLVLGLSSSLLGDSHHATMASILKHRNYHIPVLEHMYGIH